MATARRDGFLFVGEPWALLGVPVRSAAPLPGVVRRRAMAQWHPDTPSGNEEMFKLIQRAIAIAQDADELLTWEAEAHDLRLPTDRPDDYDDQFALRLSAMRKLASDKEQRAESLRAVAIERKHRRESWMSAVGALFSAKNQPFAAEDEQLCVVADCVMRLPQLAAARHHLAKAAEVWLPAEPLSFFRSNFRLPTQAGSFRLLTLYAVLMRNDARTDILQEYCMGGAWSRQAVATVLRTPIIDLCGNQHSPDSPNTVGETQLPIAITLEAVHDVRAVIAAAADLHADCGEPPQKAARRDDSPEPPIAEWGADPFPTFIAAPAAIRSQRARILDVVDAALAQLPGAHPFFVRALALAVRIAPLLGAKALPRSEVCVIFAIVNLETHWRVHPCGLYVRHPDGVDSWVKKDVAANSRVTAIDKETPRTVEFVLGVIARDIPDDAGDAELRAMLPAAFRDLGERALLVSARADRENLIAAYVAVGRQAIRRKECEFGPGWTSKFCREGCRSIVAANALHDVARTALDLVRVYDLTEFEEPKRERAGVAFADGALMPLRTGGWQFLPSDATVVADHRACHTYNGLGRRCCSTEREKAEEDEQCNRLLRTYYESTWFQHDGLRVFILAALDLVLRGNCPGRWIVLPDPSDFGKSAWVDFLIDKLAGDHPVAMFPGRFLCDEEKLTKEGHSVLGAKITKTPELNVRVDSALRKNLPGEKYLQILRKVHREETFFETFGRALRFIEVNPAHTGYGFQDAEDDFAALHKRCAVLRKKAGGRFTDNEEEVDAEKGVFLKVNVRRLLHTDGARRAFWRHFVNFSTNHPPEVVEHWMRDLNAFDADHGTSISADTADFIEKMGVRDPRNPSTRDAQPQSANSAASGEIPWPRFGVRPSRMRRKAREVMEQRVAAGSWVERLSWHDKKLQFVAHVYWPNFLAGGVQFPLPFGKRGRLSCVERPNLPGLRLQLASGEDRRPAEVALMLAASAAAGERAVEYRFYKFVADMEEGSRRVSVGPSSQSLTREARGAAFASEYFELDIANCDPSLIYILITATPWQAPPDLPHLRELVRDRDSVLGRIGGPPEAAKETLLRSLYSLNDTSQNGCLQGVVDDVRLCAEIFAQGRPALYAKLEDAAADKKKNPSRSIIAYVCGDLCNAVMAIAVDVLLANGVDVGGEIFDAVLVSTAHQARCEHTIIPTIRNEVKRALGCDAPQFACKPLLRPPFWRRTLGENLRHFAAGFGVASSRVVGGAQWTCGWRVLREFGILCGRSENAVFAEGASVRELASASGWSFADVGAPAQLQRGCIYIYLQRQGGHLDQNHYAGVGIDNEGVATVIDPYINSVAVVPDGSAILTVLLSLVHSGCGVLYLLTPGGGAALGASCDLIGYANSSSTDDDDSAEASPRANAASALFVLVAGEISHYARKLDRRAADPDLRANGSWLCPICPAREFARKQYLRTHFETHHVGNPLGCASKKQQLLIRRLYDAHQIKRAVAELRLCDEPAQPDADWQPHFARRAARLIYDHISASPSFDAQREKLQRTSNWGRYMRVVLGSQPRFVLAEGAATIAQHRISARYHATDEYVRDFLLALISPETKGARRRIINAASNDAHLSDVVRGSDLFFTVAEAVMDSDVVRRVVAQARSAAPKEVLSIDGQWSTASGVLYQAPHGSAGRTEAGDLRVLITVLCATGVLAVVPAKSEAESAAVLSEVLPNGGGAEVALLFTDSPEMMDSPDARLVLPNATIAADPLHLAFRIEKAFGASLSGVSTALRRVLLKFKRPIRSKMDMAI